MPALDETVDAGERRRILGMPPGDDGAAGDAADDADAMLARESQCQGVLALLAERVAIAAGEFGQEQKNTVRWTQF